MLLPSDRTTDKVMIRVRASRTASPSAHPLDHVERRATDVHRVPAHPQSVHPLHQHRPMSTAVQPIGECRARDAGTRNQNTQRTVHGIAPSDHRPSVGPVAPGR